MAEPPFSGLEGSLGGARRRGAGIGRYFRRSGAPGVFSEFRTIGSVFGVQGYQEGKCAVVPRKLRRAGHQQENYMQIPQKAVKWV